MKNFFLPILFALLALPARAQTPSIALIQSTCGHDTMLIVPVGPYTNLVTYEAYLDGHTWELLACITATGGNGTVCTPLRTLTTDGIDTISFMYTPQDYGSVEDYYLNLQLRRYEDGTPIFVPDAVTTLLTGLPNPTIPECTIVLPTSIVEQEPLRIEVWPNPCHDYITVTSELASEAKLYDASGATVLQTVRTSDRYTIDMSALAIGSYCLVVCDNGGHAARRIIVRE